MAIKKNESQILNEANEMEDVIKFDKGQYKSLEDATYNIYKQLEKIYEDSDIEDIAEGLKELLERKDVEKEIFEKSEADEYYDEELM